MIYTIFLHSSGEWSRKQNPWNLLKVKSGNFWFWILSTADFGHFPENSLACNSFCLGGIRLGQRSRGTFNPDTHHLEESQNLDRLHISNQTGSKSERHHGNLPIGYSSEIKEIIFNYFSLLLSEIHWLASHFMSITVPGLHCIGTSPTL